MDLLEHADKGLANGVERRHADDGDDRGDHGIFDGRSAARIGQKTGYSIFIWSRFRTENRFTLFLDPL
jgi:hypothetical protein